MSAADETAEREVAWPLFVVAGLSFIPFLGLFIGCAGATWGLISTRRNAMWAAAISILGAVANMAFFVVLAFGSARTMDGRMARDRVNEKLAREQMLKIVAALEVYHAKQHTYPPSLKLLAQRLLLSRAVPTVDLSAGFLHLPHEYHYLLAPDGDTYDLAATGPDNVIGTADDIRLALTDSLKEHTGYRPAVSGGKP